MNLKLDESGIRVRISPSELSVLARSGEISVNLPLGAKIAWRCGLRVGSSLELVVNPNSILVEIPEEMLRSLEFGVDSGKKADHEVSQLFEGVSFSLEVDYFHTRNKPTTLARKES